MTYNEALEYIHSVVWMGSRPGLSRTEELLRLLGNPEKDMNFIHVGGTNGKGSTCSMLNSVLRTEGLKVGLYTSPYIVHFNERMCINGEPISDSELAELVSLVKPLAESMDDKPTEFELITVIAFLYFKKHNCDVVVLEVGLGGRLDSTNVISSPLVSVITGVAIDHTAVLGNTVSEIAAEKAGIIKEGCPVVYGGRDKEALSVIKEKADFCNSALFCVNHEDVFVHSMDITGTNFSYGEYKNMNLSLCGVYQPENAATVLETCKALNISGKLKVSEESIRKGLETAVWRARFELLSKDPVVVFDGSHNIQGIKAAVDGIKTFFNDKVVLLMGVLADKDYKDMASLLSPLVKRVYTITPNSPRALNSTDLAEVFAEYGVDAYANSSLEYGVKEAYDYAKAEKMPLLMLGSLYMYGEVYDSFQKIK